MFLTAAGYIIIEKSEDLPVLPDSIDELFLDVETTSFDDKEEAFYPYLGDRVCGVAFTFTGAKNVYYLPVRHRDKKRKPLEANIPVEVYKDFFQRLLDRTTSWVNHNVKFDAHFFYVDGITFKGRMVDTRMLAFMLDTERFTHALKPLCRDWLKMSMTEEKELKVLLRSLKTKDYARVAIDILGAYACADVMGNIALWSYIRSKWDKEMLPLIDSEILLTAVLFDMEVEGIKINKPRCVELCESGLHEIIDIATEIFTETKTELAASQQCYYKIMHLNLGLPILVYNEDEYGARTTASYSKAAMALYLQHPLVTDNPRNKRIVGLLSRFRHVTTFNSLFINTFLDKMDENNCVHPMYNQVVRTGRMSCSDPNIQQQNEESKELIIPEMGMAFLCFDASQVEFRFIVDQCDMIGAIKMYQENPLTDYHEYVAGIVHTKRKAAKTINFAMAFGMGKALTKQRLLVDENVMAEVNAIVDAEIARGEFDPSLRTIRYAEICEKRAEEIYNTYHSEFPEISATSYKATMLCKQRGWIRNRFGRKRHLGSNGAHIAFNTVIQGGAMDYIKTRLVALAPRYNEIMRKSGTKIRANIHDEIIFSNTPEKLIEMLPYIKSVLEIHTMKDFKVPLIWQHGISEINWKEAKPK